MNLDLLSVSLSDGDIKKFFNNKVNIYKFSELSKFDNIFDVLGEYEKCIILFEIEEINNGHWCLIHIVRPKNKKPYIEFFDSYGTIPENEFNYINKKFQILSEQKKGTLLKLLLKSPLTVHYSQYRLQKLGKIEGIPVNTCGKWAVIRSTYNHLTEDQFDKAFKSISKEEDICLDLLCCLLYEELKNI